MRHPFDLDLNEIIAIDPEFLELDFLEDLSEPKSSHIDGSLRYTTQAIGEEGGSFPTPIPKPRPRPIYPRPISPPEATTLALGEEGGEMTTLAIGEEGGFPYW
jgi:hypothetical protein